MKIIVVSSPDYYPKEVDLVVEMFRSGLERYHIRKPRMARAELSSFIEAFPLQFRKRLVLHNYHDLAYRYKLGGIHLSRAHRKRGRWYRMVLAIRRKLNPQLIISRTFHRLSDLTEDDREYSYAFLSPVFDSISNNSLGSGFSPRALNVMLHQSKQPVYAMGGIRPGLVRQVKEFGFDGVVLLGILWKTNSEPLAEYFKIKQECDTLVMPTA